MIDWDMYVTSDPEVLSGKPILKNTRLSVEFVMGRLANGWSESDLLENYPALTKDSINAVYAYTYDMLKDSMLYLPTHKRA
jgi:uncharacterized protein (DUF433 family)